MPGSAVNPTSDIIDTILDEASFKTFLSALQTAGLVDILKGSGPFTVFAPTDAAFQTMPAAAIQNHLKPENRTRLTRLLEGHVVKGAYQAHELRQRLNITALTGTVFPVESSGEKISIGNAHVVGNAIACTNGVIHVIDTVLQVD